MQKIIGTLFMSVALLGIGLSKPSMAISCDACFEFCQGKNGPELTACYQRCGECR